MGKIRITTIRRVTRLVCVAALILVSKPDPALAAGTCGTGTWTLGNLEIHHINIGQGDSALIVGPTGKSLLFDAGETDYHNHVKVETEHVFADCHMLQSHSNRG